MTQPPLIDALRRWAGPGPDDRPDADLLARFVTAKDPEAFEALVRRHGGLVWGACRRRLRDVHAAEDAFQTTFLALARHAGSIKKPGTLGAWLHRVAVRCTAAVRTPRQPMSALPDDLPAKGRDPAAAAEGRDLERAIDAEIDALPEPFRLAFVLCEIEERTAADAARALGCPVGTVESRLTRARERLRTRLARRGVTVGALSGLGLATGAVPPAARAAAVALGTGAAPVPVARAALADQAARTPLLKTAAGYGLAGGFVLVGLVGVGGLFWALSRGPADGPASPASPAVTALDIPEPAPFRRNRDGFPLPPEAIARVGDPWLRHAGVPDRLAFSRDGKFLATAATGDPWLRVWDLEARRPRAHFPLAAGEVALAVGLSGDGSLARAVVRAGEDVHLREYDTFRGQEARRRAARGPVEAAVFELGARRMVVFGAGQVRLINAISAKQLWQAEVAGDRVEVGFVSHEWVSVLVPGDDRVRLFNATTGELAAELIEPRGRLSLAASSADGRTMAAWQAGTEQVVTWDVPTREVINTVKPSYSVAGRVVTYRAAGLAVTPDGAGVVAFTGNTAGFMFPVRKGGKPIVMHVGGGNSGSFSPDGSLLAVGGSGEGAVQIVDGFTGENHRAGLTEFGVPTPVEVGLATDRVLLEGFMGWIDAPAGGDGNARTIAPGISPDEVGMPVFATPSDRAALSPDRATLVRCTATTRNEEKYYILEVLDAATRALRVTIPLDGIALRPTFAPDGKTVYAVVKRYLRGWEVASGRPVLTSAEPAGEVLSRVVVSPDGRYVGTNIKLLAHSQKGGIRVWDAASGACLIAATPTHGRPHIAFSPDGESFAAVVAPERPVTRIDEGDTRIWDLKTRAVKATFRGFEGQPAFSPDGRTLAVTRPNDVALLEVATGQVRHAFRHGGMVQPALAWRADGRVLASASSEAPVYLWDVVGDRTASVAPWARAADDRRWADLTGADAGRAFEALRQLWAHPKEAAEFLRARVPAAADARLAARACEALELPGTEDGKKVLADWAAGPADAPRAREAQESLRRLAARGKAPAGDRG